MEFLRWIRIFLVLAAHETIENINGNNNNNPVISFDFFNLILIKTYNNYVE